MNNVYMIEILCKDTDNTIYNDNYRIGYKTYAKAKDELYGLVNQELADLRSMGNDYDYYTQEYIEDDNEMCEIEIHYETEDYEDMLTRYTIIKVGIEN